MCPRDNTNADGDDAADAVERPPAYPSPPGFAEVMLDRPPEYQPPGAARHSSLRLRIGSVGRGSQHVQPLALRRPLDFDWSHGVPDRRLFEALPIPSHAMGVAYVNYADQKWMLARRVGRYHVAYRSSTRPYALQPRLRLSQFIQEARTRVGAHRSASRWYYLHWDREEYGDDGDGVV